MQKIFIFGYKSCFFVALWTSFSIGVAWAGDDITIKSAIYGDIQEKKTCSPVLTQCNGLSLCQFDVSDGLCNVPAGTGSVRNLEVFWTCGVGQDRARAAAKERR